MFFPTIFENRKHYLKNSTLSFDDIHIYAKKLGNDLTKTWYFKYGVEKIGRYTGIYEALSSTYDFVKQPSLKSGTKAAISIISASKYMNPTIGLVLGISDVTGFTDWTLNQIYGK